METIVQPDWLLGLGYWGLLLGTFIAGTIVSLSSELLIIAMLVAGGDPWVCLVVSTVGNGSGLLVTYLVGRFARWEWTEKWFKVKRETLARQKAAVERFGVWSAFFGWLPVVGQVSMLALGFYKTRAVPVAAITYAGCLVRFLVWVVLYIHYGSSLAAWVMSHF
jgi:membrane protein YqaA with SNARE-associated domain